MKRTKRIIGIGCMSACAFILGSCGMRLDNQPNIKNTQPSTQVNTNTTATTNNNNKYKQKRFYLSQSKFHSSLNSIRIMMTMK